MTWLPETAPGATPLDRVFGLRPEAYERFRALYGGLWDPSGADPAVLELCRLRIASIVGSDAERAVRYEDAVAAGLHADTVAQLASWPTSPAFTDEQRACLAFAEQYVMDPHGLTDAHFDALHEHLDDRGIATLTLAVAIFDALTRFRVALGVEAAAEDGVLVAPGPFPMPASLP